ncbi:metal-dependent hydrolase [Alienimonas sp. DA493]|uniref:metal-dependent hydrolase n=1 Tax=Alienimonas sp. DA493 TaxID=3373605 RepID=UPI003754A76A
MDPLTHLLTGWLLVRALPDRWRGGDGRLRVGGLWLPTVAVVAALLPDAVEALIGPKPSEDLVRWLNSERGWSHGVLGASLSAAALWAATLPTARGDRQTGRWAAGWSPGRAAVAAFGGVGLHLLWDALTPLGLRPLYPFSGAWVRGDLVLPGDPWVHLILLSGVGLTLWREELGRWGAWSILAAVAVWLLAKGAVGELLIGRPPDELLVPLLAAGVWLVGTLHVLVLRRWRRWPRAPLIAAGLVAAFLAASLTFNALAGGVAVEATRVELALPQSQDYRPLAVRPTGILPWERLAVVGVRLQPEPFVPADARFASVKEVRLARRPPGWRFQRYVVTRGGWYRGHDLIERAGLTEDERVRAWRAWSRFPNTSPYLWEDCISLMDGPFLPASLDRRGRTLQIAPPPEKAAELRAEWLALQSD